MLLRDLLTDVGGPVVASAVTDSLRQQADTLGADGATEVTGVVLDSRAVEAGTLFACVPGANFDGHDFAAAAVDAGASVLLCERPLGLPAVELVVDSVRAALGPLADAYWGHPSRAIPVVGVTGTNGKTTVTQVLAAIFAAAGRACGVIGTLSGSRTTPEAPELQALLAGFVDDGRQVAAIEVSSHSLAQRRVDGTIFALAAFTNLSQDHLDFHGTMESYFAAKARLFEPEMAERAVVCVDDAHGRLLLDAAQIPTVGYSLTDADDIVLSPGGTSFRWRDVAMTTGLAGRFNLSNVIGAATIAAEMGIGIEAISAGLAAISPVPGRFESIDAGQPFSLVVDYAHTPDGLAKVLAAGRELAGDGRVLVVFGCGGDRDATKRPLMGEVASELADVVVVTSDNPRSEDPHAIIEDVLKGIPAETPAQVEPDRRRAVRLALAAAAPGDVVILAGKGHETTQVIGESALPFDDRVVAREELGR